MLANHSLLYQTVHKVYSILIGRMLANHSLTLLTLYLLKLISQNSSCSAILALDRFKKLCTPVTGTLQIALHA